MIFNKVLGNIDKYKNLDNFHIEKIYINSDDALKRILRVNSDHNHEYGIALDENVELKDGDILYKDDKNKWIVVIDPQGQISFNQSVYQNPRHKNKRL